MVNRIKNRFNKNEMLLAAGILYVTGQSPEVNSTYMDLLRIWVDFLDNDAKRLADRDNVFMCMVRLTEDFIVTYRKYLNEVKNNNPSSPFHSIDPLVQRLDVENTLRNAEKNFFEYIIETAM